MRREDIGRGYRGRALGLINAVAPWMAGLLPLRAFSTNFSPEPADKLDTVRVPMVDAPSQSSEFAGSYTANADSTLSVIPVQLNKHKFKTVHVTAEEEEGNSGGRWAGEQRGKRDGAQRARNPCLQRLARPPTSLFPSASSAVKQLATDVLQDIFSAITADPYGAPAIDPITAANFNY